MGVGRLWGTWWACELPLSQVSRGCECRMQNSCRVRDPRLGRKPPSESLAVMRGASAKGCSIPCLLAWVAGDLGSPGSGL